MRTVKDYDIVFSDIDNTLVYGWMTDLMEITWKLFHSDLIADTLMYLQAKFKLYKVNEMVRYQLLRARNVIFVTARKKSRATCEMLKEIMEEDYVYLRALGTDNSPEDKTEIIREYGNGLFLFFEDNKSTRWRVMKELPNVLALDPVPMREVLIG